MPGPRDASLPRWARAAMRVVPIGDRRGDVESDLAELFDHRRRRYGSRYAHWRLTTDVVSLCRPRGRGGTMRQDVRFALRLFRKHPGPIGVTIAGLGLAIGVVTAVFSVVNTTLLRPFGMDDPRSVVRLTGNHGREWANWPHRSFERMRAESSLVKIEGSIGARARFATSPAETGYDVRRVIFVSGGYFETFGGRPAIGRALTGADDVRHAPPAMVVSHAFWTTRLNADANIVGKPLWINETAVTVAGVLPASFTGPTDWAPAVWLPMTAYDALGFGAVSGELVETFGRLAPGATLAAASESLTSILVRALVSPTEAAKRRAEVTVYPSASPFDGEGAEAAIVLTCVVVVMALVLALACANTANLLLAGATTRMREIGIRLSLGSSRGRLVRQMITESLVLCVLAGAFGLVCAIWLVPIAAGLVEVPAEFMPAVDLRVLAFTAGIAALCGLAAGVAPARYGTRGDVLAATRAQHRGRRQSASRVRLSFVGAQAAMSILLLVVAALIARTAIATSRTDVGFDYDRLLAVQLSAPRADFDETAYFNAAMSAIQDIPSVERASITARTPFGGSTERRRSTIDSQTHNLFVHRTDAAYFHTAGVKLQNGRLYSAPEVENEAPVAVVSEQLARSIFRASDPVGQSITLWDRKGQPAAATIIGVVRDALMFQVDSETFGAVYVPIQRVGDNTPRLLIRTGAPGPTAHAVEEVLRRVDRRVQVQTSMVRDGVDNYLRSKRTLALMAAPVALLALVLAALGVYGVTAFAVGQRTQEVSVRMAIGATAGDIGRLLTRDGLRPVVIGLAAGLAISLGVSKVIASELISLISPYDPAAWLTAVATLLVSACVAVYFPARRAARVDPASVLRQV